jgi:putative transposase
MARLPRLAVAGVAHLLIQRGIAGQPVFVDEFDRAAYRDALRETAAHLDVALHGYALAPDRVLLLATPTDAADLGRLMQGLGRRYVAGFNRRHGRRGTLWDGRFRAAPVDPHTAVLPALVHLDTLAARSGACDVPAHDAWSSARHHLGLAREAWLVDPPQFWQLGNTPFERDSAYARLLADAPAVAAWQLRFDAVSGAGWAIGSPEFVAGLGERSARRAAPRPRGRPRKPQSA